MAFKLQSKSSRPTQFPRLAYSAPAPNETTLKEILRFTLPATKALPFVKLRANDQPLWRPECYWRVEPTGNRKIDLQLGRQYAREAIVAMKADHNRQLIAHIIQDIIKDAVERMRKKGRRNHGPIVLGFLIGISEAIAAVP